ncbi:MAG TPA: glycosyltransferase family 9 protein [Bacteroidia bacterium]|nr:glycosyltransferase family 9 protein [Bacteroidia bacterium]
MKVLVIRFSSIGDIVLTSPVIRCLKKQIPGCEIHFLTKKSFLPVTEHNPYISSIHLIENKVGECIEGLKKEKFDLVIDLHHNLRSAQVKRALKVKSSSFNKLNIEKWLLVNLRVNKLPGMHIVDRYFETVKELGFTNDHLGLDYFISEKEKVDVQRMFGVAAGEYHCLVAGGSYFTKQIPLNKLQEICTLSDKKIIVLGGKEDAPIGIRLEREFPGKVFNACGKISINQSASVIQQGDKVITSDTGLMHIASAYKKDVFSLWGNTIPEFGMSPYLPGEKSKILEVKDLSCRPCSKLGYKKCPKGHFKCMNEIKVQEIFT